MEDTKSHLNTTQPNYSIKNGNIGASDRSYFLGMINSMIV